MMNTTNLAPRPPTQSQYVIKDWMLYRENTAPLSLRGVVSVSENLEGDLLLLIASERDQPELYHLHFREQGTKTLIETQLLDLIEKRFKAKILENLIQHNPIAEVSELTLRMMDIVTAYKENNLPFNLK